ncbi:MAG: CRISPR-associated endonuclease Cas1, partial [Saezia sp.]
MLSRIVEIAEDHRHLSLLRGFMVVEDTQQERGSPTRELGRVPLDDIAAVITHANGITYTNNLLVALAQQGSPFVLCAANHNPVGMLWAIDGHSLQAKRFDAQLAAGKPVHKRLWASLVKAKL